MLGTPEIIAIVVVLFLIFGASRLPQLAKSLGQTRKAFKDGLREAELEEEEEEEIKAKQIKNTATENTVAAPQISAMTDEEVMTEMRRRAEVKQS